MKKKIGNLRGKSIVEGDINLVTANELHINSLSKSDNGGSGSNVEYEYFITDNPNDDVGVWNKVRSIASVCITSCVIGLQGDGDTIVVIPNAAMMEGGYILAFKSAIIPSKLMLGQELNVYLPGRIKDNVSALNGTFFSDGDIEYVEKCLVTKEEWDKALENLNIKL